MEPALDQNDRLLIGLMPSARFHQKPVYGTGKPFSDNGDHVSGPSSTSWGNSLFIFWNTRISALYVIKFIKYENFGVFCIGGGVTAAVGIWIAARNGVGIHGIFVDAKMSRHVLRLYEERGCSAGGGRWCW